MSEKKAIKLEDLNIIKAYIDQKFEELKNEITNNVSDAVTWANTMDSLDVINGLTKIKDYPDYSEIDERLASSNDNATAALQKIEQYPEYSAIENDLAKIKDYPDYSNISTSLDELVQYPSASDINNAASWAQALDTAFITTGDLTKIKEYPEYSVIKDSMELMASYPDASNVFTAIDQTIPDILSRVETLEAKHQ